ncbi:MAG: Trm112 family protein [Acidobacteriota bacterium]|nr:Trm112 family protein [Acidobacteriota bacterium]NLH71041.1 Trm112 family protein [Brooklawnia sp.]
MTEAGVDELGLTRQFLDIAACPSCHGSFAVDYESSELVCVNADCGLAYPVRDGIPVLLIDQARRTH